MHDAVWLNVNLATLRDGDAPYGAVRDGAIAAVGNGGSTTVPPGATVIDLSGRTIVPGLVMVHEHLYYTTGPGVYGQLGTSFSRLYLAGGVTTMRTGGNVNGIMDINVAMDLEPFSRINPCGFSGLQVTDLRSLGVDTTTRSVADALAPHLLRELGITARQEWV